jgi:hypothetical protein
VAALVAGHGLWCAAAGDFRAAGCSRGLAHDVLYPALVDYFKEELIQTVGNRSSAKPQVPGDPISLGDLCQAMFIEGARVLGFAGEATMPREVQEQVFLAATLMADGLGLLLQTQDDDGEQELTG